jgi:hypothetical protein
MFGGDDVSSNAARWIADARQGRSIGSVHVAVPRSCGSSAASFHRRCDTFNNARAW